MSGKLIVATLLTAGMLLTGALTLGAQPPPPGSAPAQTAVATPARISYINGDVSFWRPGAAEWTPARVNTPLAPGDSLFTGPNGNVEVQYRRFPYDLERLIRTMRDRRFPHDAAALFRA